MMEIKQRTYAELKEAMLMVQAFAEEQTGNRMHFSRQGLEDGLQMAGDDTTHFWKEFVSRFRIEHERFDWDQYEWTSEGFPPFPPYTLKWWIGFLLAPVLMPLAIPLVMSWALLRWVIQQVWGRDRYDKFRDWFNPRWRQKRVTPKSTVFTGKDLITSCLEGRMCTRREVRYELIKG